MLARSLQHSARNSVCARRCSWTVRTQEAIYLTRIIWYRIATAHVQNHMPANKQKNNERAANYQMRQELRALDHLHEELSAAAQLSVQSSAKPSEKLMGAELASHLVRHNWCVTTGASQLDAPHASCCMCVHRHCGCAVRSRLCAAAQCLRIRWIRRTHSPFTAPSVMGALCLAARVVKGRKPTTRISARFRRLGRFPVAAATRAHTPAPLPQQALRTSMRSVGYSILAFAPCCAMWARC